MTEQFGQLEQSRLTGYDQRHGSIRYTCHARLNGLYWCTAKNKKARTNNSEQMINENDLRSNLRYLRGGGDYIHSSSHGISTDLCQWVKKPKILVNEQITIFVKNKNKITIVENI